MNDPLESAKYMLARAKKHTLDLDRECGIYLDSNPFTRISETYLEAKKHVQKVKLIKPLPVMLNGIAADAIGNLRAALDQCGYAVSIAAGGKGKNTYFPFGDTADEVKSRKTGGSKEIPDEIFAVMESFKPYLGGDDLLWALNKLCNTNKHRILAPVVIANAHYGIDRISWTGPGTHSIFPEWDSANNEMIFFEGTAESAYYFKGQVAICVSFAEIDVTRNTPAAAVLDTLCGKIDSILMGVEAEARRIGIFK